MKHYADLYAMLKSLELTAQGNYREIANNMNFKGHQAIAELRSIGLLTPRQSGSSTVLLKWYNEHPHECLFVFKNDTVQRWMSSLFNREYNKTIVLEHVVVEAIRKAEELKIDELPKDQDPVEAIKLLREIHRQRITELRSIKYIIVDDSSSIFSYGGLKRKDFNRWVYDTFDLDVLVIHVN